jgi:hypothetical protein
MECFQCSSRERLAQICDLRREFCSSMTGHIFSRFSQVSDSLLLILSLSAEWNWKIAKKFTPVINEFHHIWRKGTETIPQGKQLIKFLCYQFIHCQSCCTIFSSYMTHVKPLLLVIKSVAFTVALLALSVSQYTFQPVALVGLNLYS